MSTLQAGQNAKSVFWPLILILTLFATLAVTYNIILPLGEISDASAHFALIRFIADNGRPPLTLEERSAVGVKGDASPLYHGLVALLTQHVDISNFPGLPRVDQKGERAIPADQRVTQTFFHTEDESFPFKGAVLAWHLAGLASIPMGMATIIAVYLTALCIYPARRYRALAAAAFVAFLPRFIISSAVINDDNLVLPLIAFSVYFLVHIIQGDERRRTFIFLGTLMGLAVITKYHSLVLIPEMTLILVMLGWRKRWGWLATLRRWGWVTLMLVVTSGWWLGFVFVQFNNIKEAGVVSGLAEPLGDPVMTVGVNYLLSPDFNPISIWEFDYWLSWTFRSFWLHYNGLDTGMAAMGRQNIYWAFFGVLAVVSLLAGLGLVKKGVVRLLVIIRQPNRLEYIRLDVALLTVHLLTYLSLAILRYMLFPAWSTSQGRHLYPALSAIALFLVVGLVEIWQTVVRHPVNDRALAAAVGGSMLGLSVLAIPLFFLPVFRPFLPIATLRPDDAAIANHLLVEYPNKLRFEGYDLPADSIRAGQAIPVTLYWRSRAKQPRDYLVNLCLTDSSGAAATCRAGQPVDGRYPTRAWETGYLIRDTVGLPTPACLPPGQYGLNMAVLPLSLDTAAAVVDESVKTKAPISLGQVTLTAGQAPTGPKVEAWAGGQLVGPGTPTMWQLRQTLTVLRYNAAGENAVQLLPTDKTSAQPWLPLTPTLVYSCPGGATVTTDNFVLHPGVTPGLYRLKDGSTPNPDWFVLVNTRARNFTPPARLDIPLNARFDNQLELLGFNVNLSPRYPGDRVKIVAYWRALRTMNRQHMGSFHLLDNTATSWGQADHPLGSDYPTLLWTPGEIVEDTYYLPIRDYVAAGLYNLKFSVYDYESGVFNFLPITTPQTPEPAKELNPAHVQVLDPLQTTPPQQPLQVTLNGQIQLLGYTVPAPRLSRETPLQVALYWQAVRPPAADYTVFTQLLGPDGQVWGQQDNQPQGGSYPTSAWAAQHTVVDRYALKLKDGSPPGRYRLLVGMYSLTNGQRLPAVNSNGQRLLNDAIELGEFTLD